MASLIFFKKDNITFRKDSKDYKEPVYVNTQIKSATKSSAAESNDDYEVLRVKTVDKTSIKEKTPERRIQGLWVQIKNRTVQIVFVVQALTIIALIATGVTLTYTGNDPIDGSWTVWTTWGQCSSTCGIGLQRRERECSDPKPEFGGKHCEGELSAYRTCSSDGCTPVDGRWTLWAEWNQCSSTCGIGQQRRERTCSYPNPNFWGKHCEGESSSYRICSASNCADLNGKWATWTEWGHCSSTCGVGQQRRNRMCSNPEPKFGGKHCEGEPSEYRICSATNCTDAVPVIAFNAKKAADLALNPNQVIVFKTVLMNYGNAYNNSDGTFYAPADGMYQFNAHLCVVSGGKDLDYAIMVDSDPKISGEYRAPSDADGGKCIGFSVVAVARKLQKVTVSFKSCSSGTGNILFQNRYDWNSFSGILVDTL